MGCLQRAAAFSTGGSTSTALSTSARVIQEYPNPATTQGQYHCGTAPEDTMRVPLLAVITHTQSNARRTRMPWMGSVLWRRPAGGKGWKALHSAETGMLLKQPQRCRSKSTDTSRGSLGVPALSSLDAPQAQQAQRAQQSSAGTAGPPAQPGQEALERVPLALIAAQAVGEVAAAVACREGHTGAGLFIQCVCGDWRTESRGAAAPPQRDGHARRVIPHTCVIARLALNLPWPCSPSHTSSDSGSPVAHTSCRSGWARWLKYRPIWHRLK